MGEREGFQGDLLGRLAQPSRAHRLAETTRGTTEGTPPGGKGDALEVHGEGGLRARAAAEFGEGGGSLAGASTLLAGGRLGVQIQEGLGAAAGDGRKGEESIGKGPQAAGTAECDHGPEQLCHRLPSWPLRHMASGDPGRHPTKKADPDRLLAGLRRRLEDLSCGQSAGEGGRGAPQAPRGGEEEAGGVETEARSSHGDGRCHGDGRVDGGAARGLGVV
mmetsp:Transcript_124275/g.310657  ORF Transcript_124275/g.310657 Transcript_124275/m.310657 type:complete len:219 (-) Transcript_124275:942-1598(-)